MFDKMLNDFNSLIDQLLVYAVVAAAIAFLLVLIYKREALVNYFNGKVKWTSQLTASGIIFGRLMPIRFPWSLVYCSSMASEGHVLCLGTSGDGKTCGLLTPSIISTRKTSTFYAYDISGDITRDCYDKNTLLLAPAPLEKLEDAEKSIPSVYWNVFAEADSAKTEEERVMSIKRLSYQLMPDAPKTSDAGVFFHGGGRKMLIGALLAYHAKGYDFCDICADILTLSAPDLLNKIDSFTCPSADAYISAFEGADEKNTAGCKQTMCDFIELFGSTESMKRILHRGKRAVNASMIETHNIILGVRKDDKDIFKQLTSLITAQVLSYLNRRQRRGKKNILFCLDEFGEIGKVDGIQSALAGLRKNGVRIILLTQSLSQLDEIYGHTVRMQIIDNMKYIHILSINSTQEQVEFAERIGKKEIRNRQTGAIMERWRIRPEKLGRLGNYSVVITPYGYKKIRKNWNWRWWI